MAKQKWYVVWQGESTGIFDNWAECKRATAGYNNAQYKSYPTKEQAEEAFEMGYARARRDFRPENEAIEDRLYSLAAEGSGPILRSLSVDAACSRNPGPLEYQGVLTWSKARVFHLGPFEDGTNNIGEFLALVHGMALLKKMNQLMPIYSDSVTALAWVRQKKCKSLLLPSEKNADLFELVRRAELWLQQNEYSAPLLKWDTLRWGEIPADFGRK